MNRFLSWQAFLLWDLGWALTYGIYLWVHR